MLQQRWLPYLLLAPAILFLVLVLALPIAQAVLLSFQSPGGSFGLESFRRMVIDIHFQGAVRNTFLLTALVVPLQVTLAIAIALLVNTRLPGTATFLYVCAIPLGISDLAAGLVWLSIFSERGYLNTILHAIGLIDRPIPYLSYEHPAWLFASVVLAEVWRATAIVMVILVAGLQLIPRDYLETADVFGAGSWTKLRMVILPLLKPSIQAALIIRTILAFQVFAVVLALTGRIIPVLAGESYFWYALYRNAHVASAYAVVIMALSAMLTWFYLRVLRVREEQMG